MYTVLLVLLILLLVGAFPAYGYNRAWGYGPASLIGVLLIVLLVLFLTGRL